MPAHILRVEPDGLPPLTDGIPRYLGYRAVASITPKRPNSGGYLVDDTGRIITVKATTISSYFYDDLEAGTWMYVPRPDIILHRGEDLTPLPGWSEDTVRAWIAGRPGAGNRLRGEERMSRRVTSPA